MDHLDAMLSKKKLGTFARAGLMVAAGMLGVLLMLGGLSLYQDWKFLHEARLISERQEQLRALAQAQQQAAPHVDAPAQPQPPAAPPK